MNGGLLAWLALGLWSAWAIALQGAWSSTGWGGSWSPEVGVVLVIGLASRMTHERARTGAVIVALTRSALSVEPLFATLAGYLLLAELVATLRSSVDTEEPLLRTSLAGVGSALLVAWFGFVHSVRADAPAPWITDFADRALPAAAATAPAAAGAAAGVPPPFPRTPR